MAQTIPAFTLGEAPLLRPGAAHRQASGGSAVDDVFPASGDTSGFAIDRSNRFDVISSYHCIYAASDGFETRMNWQGNIAACNAGSVAGDFHDDTLRRIHYYRAMVGLSTDITLAATKNAACQEAALMISRNSNISHAPSNTWDCWTEAGSNACSHGNLAWSSAPDSTGPSAVDGMIRDDGTNNERVGHRRWLLYSRAREMGNGGIPGDGSYGSSAVVWVLGDFGPVDDVPWVAWPNNGYVPYPLVPARWSLSIPGADFSNATVAMTHLGQPLSATVVHPTPASPAVAMGDPTIVWEPDGMPISAPTTDATYTVSVSGIAGGGATAVTYSVTVVHPDLVSPDLVPVGPGNPLATINNRYDFTPVSGATSYCVRTRHLTAGTWLEGAEETPTPRIIDGTGASYDLVHDQLSHTGSRAFQLAFPDFADQQFTIDRDIIPSEESTLTFVYRRRFSHLTNTLSALISGNNGVNWQTAWSVNGICSGGCGDSQWDDDWLDADVPLAPWAGQPVRIRFALAHNGSIYNGTSSSYGFFVDDITVSASRLLGDAVETNLASTAQSFSLAPATAGTYMVDMRIDGPCYSYPYGSALTVTSVPAIHITSLLLTNAAAALRFATAGGACTGYAVSRAFSITGAWNRDTAANWDKTNSLFTTSLISNTAVFYRIIGTCQQRLKTYERTKP